MGARQGEHTHHEFDAHTQSSNGSSDVEKRSAHVAHAAFCPVAAAVAVAAGDARVTIVGGRRACHGRRGRAAAARSLAPLQDVYFGRLTMRRPSALRSFCVSPPARRYCAHCLIEGRRPLWPHSSSVVSNLSCVLLPHAPAMATLQASNGGNKRAKQPVATCCSQPTVHCVPRLSPLFDCVAGPRSSS